MHSLTLRTVNGQTKIGKVFPTRLHRFNQHLLRTQCDYLIIIHNTVLAIKNNMHSLLRGSQYLKANHLITPLARWRGVGGEAFNIHHKVLRSLLYYAQFTIRHEVLHELFLLVGHEPCEVGLVFGIDTSHQFDVGAETGIGNSDGGTVGHTDFICQIPVPRTSEVAIAPRPLLLAWREMVTGHMQHAAFRIVLVAALEVVL